MICVLLISTWTYAQNITHPKDSLSLSAATSNEWACVSFPLFQGLAATAGTHHFRNRDASFVHHDSPLWEYGPGIAPLAATWMLKGLGVESRSTTKRMVVAHLTGLGLQTGLSQLLKHTAGELRPDGSDDQSFPSGHSSLAFFCASVLDREYGHHSPWISVGGYSMALLTQYRRIHQNRHYVNDVVTGAGIGLISAHLGYLITDRLFKVRGENVIPMSGADSLRLQKYEQRPTSLTLSSGVTYGSNRIAESTYAVKIDVGRCQLRTTAGYTTSLTYDYFFDSHWAVEAMAGLSQYKIQALPDKMVENGDIYGNNLYQYHLSLGSRYSLLLGSQKRVGLRVFAGERISPSVDFKDKGGKCAARLDGRNDFEYGCGMNYEMTCTSQHVSGLSVDYVHACSPLLKHRWQIGAYWRIIM